MACSALCGFPLFPPVSLRVARGCMWSCSFIVWRVGACRMVLCGHVAGGPASHSAIPHGLVYPGQASCVRHGVCGLALCACMAGAAVLPTALPHGVVSSYGADGYAAGGCCVLWRMVLCGVGRGGGLLFTLFLTIIPSHHIVSTIDSNGQ
jgi:hypothetical protein